MSNSLFHKTNRINISITLSYNSSMADWNKWMEVVDCIFVNKDKYNRLTDKDKIDSFFIINKKFAYKYPQTAQFFNKKTANDDSWKASAMDQWFEKFKSQRGIPGWYWATKSKKNTIKAKKEKDYDKIAERYGLDEEEMKFLIEFFKKDLDNDLKQIKLYEQDE